MQSGIHEEISSCFIAIFPQVDSSFLIFFFFLFRKQGLIKELYVDSFFGSWPSESKNKGPKV